MRFLSLITLISLLVSFIPVQTTQARLPQQEGILSMPASVTLVGDLQTELGCSSDWDPGCTFTQLIFDAEDQVWQMTFTIPAGNWEYKVATNGDWSNPYPPGYTNLNLNLSSTTPVKFYFSHQTPWLADNINKVIAVAVGDFQSELGCSSGGVGGDWDTSCLRSWMQDQTTTTSTRLLRPQSQLEVIKPR